MGKPKSSSSGGSEVIVGLIPVFVVFGFDFASVVDLSSPGCSCSWDIGGRGSLLAVTDDELFCCGDGGASGLFWSPLLSSPVPLALLLKSSALWAGVVIFVDAASAAAARDPPVPPSLLLSGCDEEAATAEPEPEPVSSRSGMAIRNYLTHLPGPRCPPNSR